jgi:hypothetical protein
LRRAQLIFGVICLIRERAMRHATIVFSIGLIAVVCLAGAKSGPGQEPATYQCVLQQGDVKVTLLKVARITSFIPANANGRARIVPAVEVTYAVEDVGSTPLGQFHVGGVKCFVKGKPAVTTSNVVGGGQGVTEPWSATDAESGLERPRVASAQRSRLRREYLRGIVVDRDRIDLHIETGFGDLQTFKFENVPLASYLQMPVQENPDVEFPIVSVNVVLPGAAPGIIESEIIKPLEAEINTIEGLRQLNSTAREQSGTIIAEFELWRDIDVAAQDVRDAVERARRLLPTEVEAPIVRKLGKCKKSKGDIPE